MNASGAQSEPRLNVQRNAGAPRLIEWTGERCVPWAPDVPVVYEHMHRYLWAALMVRGRRVLDLGSGEGFGASILAESAQEVVGLDVDQRTVDHSQVNYARPGLSFHLGTATDLSMFDEKSFGAVVAFEIIEHVGEQELVLAQIARVLRDDGVLILSTPDRRPYTDASGQTNPFHVHELTLEEVSSLLSDRFRYQRIWGQRLITGSHIALLDAMPEPNIAAPSVDFFIERTGDEWRIAPAASPMYVLAVASAMPLEDVLQLSTLADPGVELLRVRDGEIAGLLESIRGLEAEVLQTGDSNAELGADLATKESEASSLRADLEQTLQTLTPYEYSVTIQLFRRLRERLYGAIGRRSLLGRALQAALRLVGRVSLRTRDS